MKKEVLFKIKSEKPMKTYSSSEDKNLIKPLCENGDKIEDSSSSLILGIVVSLGLFLLGFSVTSLFINNFLFKVGVGIFFIGTFGIPGFFTIAPGNAAVRVRFGHIISVLDSGPYWEPWKIITHKEMRVREFSKQYTTEDTNAKVKLLSSEDIKIGINITVRIIVTNAEKYYLEVVSTPGDAIHEIIGSYLRIYLKAFKAKEIPDQRGEISLWIQGNSDAFLSYIREHPDENHKKNLPKCEALAGANTSLNKVIKNWGIVFKTVIVEQIVLPDEIVKETEEKNARQIELDGMQERFHELVKMGMDPTEAWKIVERQDEKRTTIELDSNSSNKMAEAATIFFSSNIQKKNR